MYRPRYIENVKNKAGWDLPLLFRLKLDDDDDDLGINGAKYDNLFTNKFINRVVSRQR